LELHAECRPAPIVRTVATEGKGVAELLDKVGQGSWPVRDRPGGLSHIDHLGIAVRSLEESIAFYESLGLAVSHRETVPQEKVHVALLPTADSRLELLEPSAPDSPISKFLEKRGPGLHHVALRVPDLAAAVARLRAAGAKLLNEPRQGAGGHTYVFVHPASTGGVLLELIQESGS
jgi:methylmalonyl-CoA epimerase